MFVHENVIDFQPVETIAKVAGSFMNETAVSTILDVQGLEVHFGPANDPVRAVDQVDFQIFPGEIVALVGESGSGKSISALSIANLISISMPSFGIPKDSFAANSIFFA